MERIYGCVKEAVFFVFLYCGYVQVRDFILACLGRSRVVVLYYHRVGERDVLTRTANSFRDDLSYLKSNYECISFREMCERLGANQSLRRRSVVITFDDGYRDNLIEALPILKEIDLTATFFVATGFVGTGREFPHDLRGSVADERVHFPKLTWDDLRMMEEEGFEVGSHTVNHANMGSANREVVEREMEISLEMLNQKLGAKPRAFSFPWGKPQDISDWAIEVAQRAGYYAATSAYGGTNTRGANLFNIRRIDVGNGELSRLAVRARVAGFDPDYYRLKLKKWNV